MIRALPLTQLGSLLLMLGCAVCASAQCTTQETSSDGYTVSVFSEATAILPSSLSCPFGYNYNITVGYTITYSGTNIPGSMYTLQGSIYCGADQHFFNLPNGGTNSSGSVNTASNPYRTASDCATATPSSIGCDSSVIEIQGSGLTTTLSSCSNAPLPVELIHFSATLDNGQVLINWSTASERDNAYFEVERSFNGSNWQTLSRAAGAGNSNQVRDYDSVDRFPLKGMSYYRIKQVDFNGERSYSALAGVYFNQPQAIRVWPNPAGDVLTVQGDVGGPLYLSSLLGQRLLSAQPDAKGQWVFDVSALPSGTYLLHTASGSTVQRVVVQ